MALDRSHDKPNGAHSFDSASGAFLPLASTVLIVDDELFLTMILRKQLEQRGYTVLGTAANGREAVAFCKSQTPDFVFMDILMPEMDGLEATRQIMEENPACIIVLTTGGKLKEAAYEAGAMTYIHKPLHINNVPGLFKTTQIRFQNYLTIKEQTPNHQETLSVWLQMRAAAKLLREQFSMTEEQAFQEIADRSYQQPRPFAEIIHEILKSNPTPEMQAPMKCNSLSPRRHEATKE